MIDWQYFLVRCSYTIRYIKCNWHRWLFRRCLDCGAKLPSTYNRGDVCKSCFDAFDGMTEEDLVNAVVEDLAKMTKKGML